ncbi:MAG TPA: ABC transporter permease [Bryobacteraceae bacterium]|nr:ABC transporter permease [Bryobacteraceae bacterium]
MWMLLKDLRYGLRLLRLNPGFTAVAVLSLALGIGANVAIFQLLDAVRLRTLPVKEPQRLAMMQLADRTGWRGNQQSPYATLTNPIWERFRDNQDALGPFSGVLAWASNDFNLATGGEVRLARGLFVSGDFFRVLGVQPLQGRVFTAADDRRGCGLPGAVISYGFWQRELAGDAAVIGRKLSLNDQVVEIVGVTPAGFSGVEIGRAYDLAVPICSQAVLWSEGNWLNEGTTWWLTVMGRLKPGWTLQKANAQLRAGAAGLFRATLPANYPAANVKDYLKFKLEAVPAKTGVSALRTEYSDPLYLLLATTGLVLLIACSNLANLTLARATAREHEIAVRLAIGASRGRLVRQLMAESILLALAGGACGLLPAGELGHLMLALLRTPGDSLFLDLEPDVRVFAFATGIAALTCILFGLIPALRATRRAPADVMKTGGRSVTTSRERFGLRQTLVVSQVALSLVLLVSALLFSGSLRKLLAVDAGFRQNGILIVDLDFSRLKIPVARRAAFKQDILQRMRALPGTGSAGETYLLPLSGASTSNNVWVDGAGLNAKMNSNFGSIGAGYLKTMGMTLLAGRDFDGRDTPSSPPAAIVNQTFARMLGLGDNPVGKRFRREATPSRPETVFEVAGLVKDTKYYSLREEFRPIAFLCTAQDADPDPFAQFVVRFDGPLADVTSRIKQAVKAASPGIIVDYRAFDETIREGLLRERLMATLSGFFGALAALIAAVGLYGVMSYLVVRRTNEIGIRMALGANSGNIVRLVLREAATLLAVGLAAGAVLAVAAGYAAGSLLFGLRPTDAGILAMAAGLLAAVTIAASYLPAWRAARLDPMTALREE